MSSLVGLIFLFGGAIVGGLLGGDLGGLVGFISGGIIGFNFSSEIDNFQKSRKQYIASYGFKVPNPDYDPGYTMSFNYYKFLPALIIIVGAFVGNNMTGNNGAILGIVAGAVISYYVYKYGKEKSITEDELYDECSYNERESGDQITTYVAGISFENRQNIAAKLNVGDTIYLKRDKDNSYDKNAIEVIVKEFSSPYTTMILGYLPRDLAENIAPIFDHRINSNEELVHGKVDQILKSPDKPIGVRISFFLP